MDLLYKMDHSVYIYNCINVLNKCKKENTIFYNIGTDLN
jgi:hypothetical protein